MDYAALGAMWLLWFFLGWWLATINRHVQRLARGQADITHHLQSMSRQHLELVRLLSDQRLELLRLRHDLLPLHDQCLEWRSLLPSTPSSSSPTPTDTVPVKSKRRLRLRRKDEPRTS